MDKSTCSAPEGCDRAGDAGYGLCRTHYSRLYRTGSTEKQVQVKAKCSICDEPVKGHGWCSMHYQRWCATGDPLTEPVRPAKARSNKIAREELETGLRKCRDCKEIKPLDCFAVEAARRNGRAHACPPCRSATFAAAYKRRKQRDPESLRRRTRNVHLQAEYGMTIDDWDAMVAKQRGRCAACGKKTKLVLDHDHDTGHVRGLLCNPCNLSLGFAEDSIKRLEQLLAYLLAHKGRIF